MSLYGPYQNTHRGGANAMFTTSGYPPLVDGLQSSGSLVNSFKQMVAQRAPAVETLATASATLSAAGACCTAKRQGDSWQLFLTDSVGKRISKCCY